MSSIFDASKQNNFLMNKFINKFMNIFIVKVLNAIRRILMHTIVLRLLGRITLARSLYDVSSDAKFLMTLNLNP